MRARMPHLGGPLVEVQAGSKALHRLLREVLCRLVALPLHLQPWGQHHEAKVIRMIPAALWFLAV